MADVFDRLIEGVLGREGGYVNHPDDRGGETIWGITVAVARRFGYAGPMRSMTRGAAIEIYRKQYWTSPGYDLIAKISEPVAEELFDTGINMGPAVASSMLQRSLNALNRQGKDYPDIKVGGAAGPASRRSLESYLRIRGSEGVSVLLKALNCLQGERYIDLAEKRQANETFVYGWLRTRVSL